ncbi:hypothetical protein TWF694_008507 [Orbilia ellipsospora]|uniref:Uncharacterized protein n=1 Tax=Orbilia ellipsospora TaxID=2528407 RepID=A0AAV9XGC0_9PEZI
MDFWLAISSWCLILYNRPRMVFYIVVGLALIKPVWGGYDWDDFADNFATDLAPVIVLFGEQVTKQFLSESISFLDNIIFALAPLGVLTAVVSVIRVCGNSSLKAFIGRAQEAHGIAEAELCSSTSRDVCELWSNGGISRVFGRPKILEFIYSRSTEFYPEFPSGQTKPSKHPSCGIHRPKSFLCREISVNEEAAESGFAPHPNLSLNIGIRPLPRWLHWLVMIFGILLQLSFFGYATWAAYYATSLWNNSIPPQKWAFPFATIGTGSLVIGMGLCAMLIERRTQERTFKMHNGPKEKVPHPLSILRSIDVLICNFAC